jgi:ATP-dependent DNA ligase
MANSILDSSRMQLLFGAYSAGKAQAALSDPFLPLKAQGYRRNLAARMIALDKAAAKLKLPAGDCLVSRKIDGECSLLLIDGKECIMINPGGTVRAGLPLMAEALELMGKSKFKQLLIAGELYVSRDDRRPRVHDVSRVARQPESQAEVDSLHLAVFDILEIDGKPAPVSYADTFKKIETIFKGGKRIYPVETVKAKTVDDILSNFETWVEKEGAEGIVVRSDASGMFKVKPRISVDVAVLGYTEGTQDRTGMIHDLLVGLMRKDESFHVLGRVGGGFTDDQRREWLSDLKDMAAESDYAEVNEGVAYQMVRPEWVAEISCLDLISQNTRGSSVDRIVLGYDQPKNMYQSIRKLPLASPISPVFIRRREDKRVRHEDLRMQQVADVIEVPMMDQDARKLTLARSELLKREVFTKTLKGNLMVRKLLLWKTNKQTPGGNFPAFVAYLTDFSPGRADPMQREIRISNSQAQIEQLYAALKEENIVKGWAPA